MCANCVGCPTISFGYAETIKLIVYNGIQLGANEKVKVVFSKYEASIARAEADLPHRIVC